MTHKVPLIFEVQAVINESNSTKCAKTSFMVLDDDRSLDFTMFKRYLAQEVGVSENVPIKYVDEDNDQIPIESENEFEEAMKVARDRSAKGKVLMLIVNLSGSGLQFKEVPESSLVNPEVFETNVIKNQNVLKNMAKHSKSKMTSKKKPDDKAYVKISVHRGCQVERGRNLSMNGLHSGHRSSDRSRSGLRPTPAVNIRTKMLQQLMANIPCPPETTNSFEQPPAWFTSYMDKFKRDLLLAIRNMVFTRIDQLSQTTEAKPKRLVKRHSEDESSDNQQCSSEQRSCKILRKLEKLQKREKKLEHKLDQRFEKMENKKKRMIEKVSQTKTIKRKSCEGMGTVPYLMSGISVRPLSPITVKPGEMFSRTWQILNDGKIPWTDVTEMRQAWSSAGLLPIKTVVKCPTLVPGEEGIITVVFVAPATAGTYHSYWHLFHMGERFGHWIVCTVIVETAEKEAAEATGLPESSSNNFQEFEKELADKLNAVNLDMNPEYVSGSDLEVCSNVSESDSTDSFVVVDLPVSLFSDTPALSKGTIPVKVRSKNCTVYSKTDQKKNAKSARNDCKAEEASEEITVNTSPLEAKSNEIDLTHCKPVQENIYMVDRAGNCFVAPPTQSSGIYPNLEALSTATCPTYTQEMSPNLYAYPPVTSYSYAPQNAGCLERPSWKTSNSSFSANKSGKTKEETGKRNSNISAQLTDNKRGNYPSSESQRNQNPSGDTTQESPVHILPETLVSGAINVASKAYNTAQSVLSNLRTKQGEASEFDPVFESNLATLFEMGFTNTARNAEVLRNVGNDIGRAVPILLTKSHQQ